MIANNIIPPERFRRYHRYPGAPERCRKGGAGDTVQQDLSGMRDKIGYGAKHLCLANTRIPAQTNALTLMQNKTVRSIDKKSQILYTEATVVI